VGEERLVIVSARVCSCPLVAGQFEVCPKFVRNVSVLCPEFVQSLSQCVVIRLGSCPAHLPTFKAKQTINVRLSFFLLLAFLVIFRDTIPGSLVSAVSDGRHLKQFLDIVNDRPRTSTTRSALPFFHGKRAENSKTGLL
jgi:hypothetical protein